MFDERSFVRTGYVSAAWEIRSVVVQISSAPIDATSAIYFHIFAENVSYTESVCVFLSSSLVCMVVDNVVKQWLRCSFNSVKNQLVVVSPSVGTNRLVDWSH